MITDQCVYNLLFVQEGQPTTVFLSATYLIHQTNMVMITVKDKCE